MAGARAREEFQARGNRSQSWLSTFADLRVDRVGRMCTLGVAATGLRVVAKLP
jgi:hypothetical protein